MPISAVQQSDSVIHIYVYIYTPSVFYILCDFKWGAVREGFTEKVFESTLERGEGGRPELCILGEGVFQAVVFEEREGISVAAMRGQGVDGIREMKRWGEGAETSL